MRGRETNSVTLELDRNQMNWEAIQAVAELSAAVGVLLSLVYVGLQVRQNTAALQAGTVARSSELMQRTRLRRLG